MSTYGYNERREWELLRERYQHNIPSLIDGYRTYLPEDYLRYLDLEKIFNRSAEPAELRKNDLTDKARKAEKEKQYLAAEKLWLEIAEICHQQGGSFKEENAYWVEHRAKQCRHMQIYKDAHISIHAFPNIPNVDKLQDALTDAAAKKLEKKDYATCTLYSLLNARLCHAQGKERDAFLLEEAVRSYGFFDIYFVRPGEGSKNAAIEEISLRQIASEYQSELYPK